VPLLDDRLAGERPNRVVQGPARRSARQDMAGAAIVLDVKDRDPTSAGAHQERGDSRHHLAAAIGRARWRKQALLNVDDDETGRHRATPPHARPALRDCPAGCCGR
jgi:hypothetical protein